MRPGVVSALIEAGADADGLRAASNLDAAFAMLEPEPEPESESEPDAEADREARADTGADPEDNPPLESEQTSGDER
jgi:hypothetical protein